MDKPLNTAAHIIVLWFANHLHFKVNELLLRRVASRVILPGGISLFFR